MLFVKKEELEIWSSQEGGVSRNPSFLLVLYSFKVLQHIKGYPLDLHCMYIKMRSCHYFTSKYGLLYSNLFLAAGRLYTSIIVHGAQTIRILLSMFPFSLFLGRRWGMRSIEKHLRLCTNIFFLSKQGVLPCFIPHKIPLSHVKLGVLYKYLTVLKLRGN